MFCLQQKRTVCAMNVQIARKHPASIWKIYYVSIYQVFSVSVKVMDIYLRGSVNIHHHSPPLR